MVCHVLIEGGVCGVCRDKDCMDFVIVTIPTVLALEESSRLLKALRKEGVPTSTVIVNQIIGERMGDTYIKMKLKEQTKAMEMLAQSPHLDKLEVIRGKMVDLEVRGVPALQYFATTLWQGLPIPDAAEGEGLVRTGVPTGWSPSTFDS
jgi:arsenite/tail-anchored protein-transporting ATPase